MFLSIQGNLRVWDCLEGALQLEEGCGWSCVGSDVFLTLVCPYLLISGLVGCANKGQISGTAYDGYLNSPKIPSPCNNIYVYGQRVFQYEGLMHYEG